MSKVTSAMVTALRENLEGIAQLSVGEARSALEAAVDQDFDYLPDAALNDALGLEFLIPREQAVSIARARNSVFCKLTTQEVSQVVGRPEATYSQPHSKEEFASVIAQVKRPERIQAAFEVFDGKEDTGPTATALFEYIKSLEAKVCDLQNETDFSSR